MRSSGYIVDTMGALPEHGSLMNRRVSHSGIEGMLGMGDLLDDLTSAVTTVASSAQSLISDPATAVAVAVDPLGYAAGQVAGAVIQSALAPDPALTQTAPQTTNTLSDQQAAVAAAEQNAAAQATSGSGAAAPAASAAKTSTALATTAASSQTSMLKVLLIGGGLLVGLGIIALLIHRSRSGGAPRRHDPSAARRRARARRRKKAR